MIQDFSSPNKSIIYSRIVIDLIVMPIVFNAQRERETLAITRNTYVSQTLAKLGVPCIQEATALKSLLVGRQSPPLKALFKLQSSARFYN